MAAIQHAVMISISFTRRGRSAVAGRLSVNRVQCRALCDACDAHPGYANHVVSTADQIVGQTGAILARKLGYIGDTDSIFLLAAASCSSWAADHDIAGVAGMGCREGEWKEVEGA